MRRISVVQAFSGETATTSTVETFTTEVNFVINDVMYTPAYVQEMELEIDETAPAVQDQCGRTEVFPMGDSNWTLTISGYVTDRQGSIAREDNQTAMNLSHEKLKSLREGSLVTIDSALHHGNFVVNNIVLGMDSDIITIGMPQSVGSQEMVENLAFAFQIQLKEV